MRRFVAYRPNSQVQAFFNELKKRRTPAPVNETVHLSSGTVKGRGEGGNGDGYKKPRRKKSATRKVTKRKQTSSQNGTSKKSKKSKSVDKKLRGVKL